VSRLRNGCRMAWASTQSRRSSSALTWDPGSNLRPGEGRPPLSVARRLLLVLAVLLVLVLVVVVVVPILLVVVLLVPVLVVLLSLSPFLWSSFLPSSFLSSSWPFLSLSWWSKSLGSNRSPHLSHHSSQSPPLSLRSQYHSLHSSADGSSSPPADAIPDASSPPKKSALARDRTVVPRRAFIAFLSCAVRLRVEESDGLTQPCTPAET
jgi:hypothetical protein